MSRRTLNRRSAAVISHALIPAAALAQQPEETIGDRWLAPPIARRTSTPYVLDAGGVFVRQANVNAQGQNIVGDAANEPSIAIDPTAPNRIVIGWRQFDTIASNFRQAGYAWSNDGGRTWHFDGVLTPGVFRSDPVLETNSDGVFFYYTLPSTASWICELFRSTDGGRTWSGPVYANGGDRAWFTIDKSGGIGDGNLYAFWKPGIGCCGNNTFGRDLSGGMLPWPAATAIPGFPIRGTIAVGPDGEVYAVGESFGVSRSDNARDPLQVPVFTSAGFVWLGGPFVSYTAPNPGGLVGQVWVDVNRSSGPARGHVYVASVVDPPTVDPLDIMFARSTDNGMTWSPPVRVNPDPPAAGNWNWFPSMSVALGGRIDITYNSTHESGQATICRVYYTSSVDEGQTWSTPFPLTPAWNSVVGWPNQSKIGDYYDQESDDVGLFLAISATMTGGQDVYFVRVGDWDCNRNGVGDEQDLAAGVLHDCDRNAIPDECEIAAGAKPDLNANGIPDICECYPDCTADGQLTVADFGCFQTRFVAADPYADCNADGSLTVADFGCFQTRFATGCP